MKKIIVTLAIVIFAFITKAQEKVHLDNVASVELPTGAQKVTAERAKVHVMSKLNGNKADLNSIAASILKQRYLFKNVLVDFHTEEQSVEANHIIALKKGMDAMSKGDLTYHSSIQTDNDKSVLLFDYRSGDIQRYGFISFNKQYLKAASGSIECNIADIADGKKAFDMIIKSLKFE